MAFEVLVLKCSRNRLVPKRRKAAGHPENCTYYETNCTHPGRLFLPVGGLRSTMSERTSQVGVHHGQQLQGPGAQRQRGVFRSLPDAPSARVLNRQPSFKGLRIRRACSQRWARRQSIPAYCARPSREASFRKPRAQPCSTNRSRAKQGRRFLQQISESVEAESEPSLSTFIPRQGDGSSDGCGFENFCHARRVGKAQAEHQLFSPGADFGRCR